MTYKPRSERKRAKGGKATAETEPLHPEHGHQYNAQGSPEEKEETAKSDGFKHGGHVKKRKHGGHVEGQAAKHHLGKRARGGATVPHHIDLHMGDHHEHDGHDGPHHGTHHDGERPDGDHHHKGGHVAHRARGGRAMARGGSPFSAAQKTKPPGNDRESGPGEQAPMIP